MGNARKPDNLHLLKGSFRKDRHGDPEEKPRFDAKIPAAPQILSGQGLKEWGRITKILQKSGLITLADMTVVTQYCVLWDELFSDPKEFTAAKHTQLRMICVELGLTPSARSKIVISKQKEKNDFDDV